MISRTQAGAFCEASLQAGATTRGIKFNCSTLTDPKVIPLRYASFLSLCGPGSNHVRFRVLPVVPCAKLLRPRIMQQILQLLKPRWSTPQQIDNQ